MLGLGTSISKSSYRAEGYPANAFVFIVSFIIWFLMRGTFGIRLSKEGETKGTDVTETGVIAYAIRD